jgi:Family of unknown function (DUF5681)
MVAEKTARKQRGRPFRKGRSGNPRGRPLGARNRATIAMEALLDGEAEAITRKAVEKAKEGDTTALRLCLERILPPRKDRPIALLMPKLSTVADAATLMAAITSAVAIGDVTTSEAAELAKLIDTYVRAVEATDLDKRLRAIEQAMTK